MRFPVFIWSFKAPISFKRRSFVSIRCFSYTTHQSQYSPTDKHNQLLDENSTNILNPRVVLSTLLKCPSDLVALSFFLWFARQPNYFHGRDIYAHMVDVVARLTQRFVTVGGIVEQLKTVGCPLKPQTLILLLRIYWFGGKHDMVFDTFKEMLTYGYTPNTFARNIVMDVLFKIGRVEVALRVLNETQLPNYLSFSIAICNLCRLNDFTSTQGVLRKMMIKGYHLNAETFSIVLNCYCKLRRLKEVLQLFSLMITLGISVSVKVWGILIDGFCRSGRLDMAGYLLKRMVESGCSPNVVVCTSLIKGFIRANKLKSAFDILNTLENKGYHPDVVLCNVLIDSFSKMGRYDDALDIFLSFPIRKIVPDAYTFCSVMSAICLSRQFVLLPTLISGVAFQADLVVCNSLINYFCEAGYPSGAVEFYNDMINRDFIPDKYTYTGLLRGLCRVGRISEAVKVYRGIVGNHSGLDACFHTVIVDELVKAGYFDRAIKLFHRAVRDRYPLDVVSYTVAISGLVRGDRVAEAHSLFDQMKMVGVEPNIYTYNEMLSGFCSKKDVKMVKQIVQEMTGVGIEMNYKTFKLLKSLLHRTRFSQSIFDLLIESCNLKLMPKQAISTLLLDGLSHGVNISDAQPSLFKDNVVDIHDTSTSSSDDLSDVAVSVG